MRFAAIILPIAAMILGFLAVIIHEYQIASFAFGAAAGSVINTVVCLPVRRNGDQW